MGEFGEPRKPEVAALQYCRQAEPRPGPADCDTAAVFQSCTWHFPSTIWLNNMQQHILEYAQICIDMPVHHKLEYVRNMYKPAISSL